MNAPLAHPDNWPTFVSAAAPVTRTPCRCGRLPLAHRFSADCAEFERAEHAAIDRAIERDGDPDREYDSRGWE